MYWCKLCKCKFIYTWNVNYQGDHMYIKYKYIYMNVNYQREHEIAVYPKPVALQWLEKKIVRLRVHLHQHHHYKYQIEVLLGKMLKWWYFPNMSRCCPWLYPFISNIANLTFAIYLSHEGLSQHLAFHQNTISAFLVIFIEE